MLDADGDPGYLVGVLDPLSDLVTRLRASGAAVVAVLDDRHRTLADAFGYVAPAPGGPFAGSRWTDSEWGPVLDGVSAWAGARVSGELTELGWGVQACLVVEHVELSDDAGALVHRRGRYHSL
jgi:flavin reductase (DIM6/NTAB) family NADH-FMN oxidoreductase RutF